MTPKQTFYYNNFPIKSTILSFLVIGFLVYVANIVWRHSLNFELTDNYYKCYPVGLIIFAIVLYIYLFSKKQKITINLNNNEIEIEGLGKEKITSISPKYWNYDWTNKGVQFASGNHLRSVIILKQHLTRGNGSLNANGIANRTYTFFIINESIVILKKQAVWQDVPPKHIFNKNTFENMKVLKSNDFKKLHKRLENQVS